MVEQKPSFDDVKDVSKPFSDDCLEPTCNTEPAEAWVLLAPSGEGTFETRVLPVPTGEGSSETRVLLMPIGEGPSESAVASIDKPAVIIL